MKRAAAAGYLVIERRDDQERHADAEKAQSHDVKRPPCHIDLAEEFLKSRLKSEAEQDLGS